MGERRRGERPERGGRRTHGEAGFYAVGVKVVERGITAAEPFHFKVRALREARELSRHAVSRSSGPLGNPPLRGDVPFSGARRAFDGV
jgi:hypothetical protein